MVPQNTARSTHPAACSWLQCFKILIGNHATRKALTYALWAITCSDPDCCDKFNSPLCVNGLYALHRLFVLMREHCVNRVDHEMCVVLPPATVEVWKLLSAESEAA